MGSAYGCMHFNFNQTARCETSKRESRYITVFRDTVYVKFDNFYFCIEAYQVNLVRFLASNSTPPVYTSLLRIPPCPR